MKKILLAFALSLFTMIGSAATAPPALQPCMSGMWYNPATSGSGITLLVDANTQVITWYTYFNDHVYWLIGQGLPTDTQIPMALTTGHNPTVPGTGIKQVGLMSFVPDPNNPFHATFSWSFDPETPFCSGFSPMEPWCSGHQDYYALLIPNRCVTNVE